MKTLVYVLPSLDTCGGIRIALEHCNRLRNDFDVYILNLGKRNELKWFDNNVQIINKLEFTPDIIVATFWKTVEYIEQQEIARNSKKFYLIQGKEPYFYDNAELHNRVKMTYFKGYRHICISKSLVEWQKREFDIDADYVRNGLDFKMFYPDPRIATRRYTILIEGNDNFYYKNVEQGFVALQDLRKIADIWYLAYQGGGIDSKYYDRAFLNPSQDELRQIYSSAHIFFKPTLLEGASLPIMEAMACNTAVVSSNIDGVREYLNDRVNCMLAKKGNVRNYIYTLKQLLVNDNFRRAIADNGYNTAIENFNWNDIIPTLKKIYEKD